MTDLRQAMREMIPTIADGDGIRATNAEVAAATEQNKWVAPSQIGLNPDVAANTADRHVAVTVADSDEIDFTLTGQQISASLKAGSIDETKLDASVNASLDLADTSLQPDDIGVSVQAYSAVLAATTASFTTADETKLDGIEAGADVTDATNVAAAGAVMESDTSTVSMSFVIDEDDMASDLATKVPTQQSVKAYVDANAGASDAGDISFTQAGTGATASNVEAKLNEYVSILDFGAVGDGDIANASANATALTNALATGKRVWIPYTADGYHFGTNQIEVGTGQVIEGENQVLLKSTATTSLFRMVGFEVTSGIHNVKIDMTGSGASSTAIRFGTSSLSVYRVRLSKIKFANCVEAIGDEVHVSNAVVDIMIDDCMCWLTRGRQIYLRRSAGFILIRSTNVDFTQDTGLVAWEGIRIENFAGLELERVDVLGWGTGTRAYNASIYGIVISTGQALWLTRVFVDSYVGIGIFISAASYVFSTYLETSLCNGVGILLASVSNGVFANTLVNGNNGVTGAAAGAQGIYLDTVTDCTFSTTLVYNMSGSGIAAVNANNRVTFTGTVTNSNLFGLAIQGTSANVKFLGGSMNGNGTPVSNTATGAGNVIEGLIGYNGHKSRVTTTAAKALTNNVTTAQNIFASANDTVSMEASTAYRFKCVLHINTGATSHTTSFGFGGTATFTSIDYTSMATSSAANTLAAPQMRRVSTASATALTAASTAVTTEIVIEGIMRINAAGTLIPQITFSAGPTGTCEVAANSFFEFEAIGPSADAADGGGWS